MTVEWMWTPAQYAELDYATLPPDWTVYTPSACGARVEIHQGCHCNLAWALDDCARDCCPDGYRCTRLDGHSGRHAAGDGRRIVAVWPRDRLDDALAAAHRQINAQLDARVRLPLGGGR